MNNTNTRCKCGVEDDVVRYHFNRYADTGCKYITYATEDILTVTLHYFLLTWKRGDICINIMLA